MHRDLDFELELAEIGRPSGFRSLIGYKTVAWREGYAEILLKLEPKHLNSHNNPHGGLYVTLIDAAMGHAATFCAIPENRRLSVTVGLQTNFLAPGQGAYLRTIARLVSAEGRHATCSGEVIDAEGTRCCVGLGTFRYNRGCERPEGVPKEPA